MGRAESLVYTPNEVSWGERAGNYVVVHINTTVEYGPGDVK